ncbi:MAG TPA: amino acid adenylation domain-containing protein [Ferruginibacter sp.]|nr:amino acid adenylation domain-containing protein [Ferruginibacter sp.]
MSHADIQYYVTTNRDEMLEYYGGESVAFSFDENLSAQLQSLSRQQNANMHTVLLSVFKILLYRYSNQEEISIASLFCLPDNKKAIGINDRCVKELILHSEMNGNTHFDKFLHQVKHDVVHAIENKTAGLKSFQKETTASQAMFILEGEPGIPAVDIPFSEFLSNAASKPDLVLIIKETTKGCKGTLLYQPQAYQKITINRMIDHYNQLLTAIIKEPHQKIGALDMLTQTEQDAWLQFNDTISPYSSDTTVVALFEEQVVKTPDHIALHLGEELMTYHALNEKANRLAHYLLEHGLHKGDNTALVVTRSFEMIIGMYAILKAGGTYVPIDPDYPLDRQQYILNQSSVKLVLADDDYAIKDTIGSKRFIKMTAVDLATYSSKNPEIKIDTTQLAYTIYTSGSTGRPKGVMIEHHSVVNLVQWVNETYNVGADDRLLFITSMCFDLSVYDIFGILAVGGTLVIARKQDVQDVKKLQEMLQTYAITFWDSVPTTMDYLVRELETSDRAYKQTALKTVFMSGDWIPVDLPARIKKYFPETAVISLGGATEGTVWSNYFPVEQTKSDWKSIPYGKPLQNNFFYILNEQLQPVPQGVIGELYIGGVGVARGYANDKEKTAYSFVKDPFNKNAGGMMYRTGDLGRMLPDMNMEFIGRKDDQVKIRGFRVELGEIESVLTQSDLVRQAIVLAKNDRENKKRLIGYIIPHGKYNQETIIAHLKSKLPEYMIPSLWLELDSLPLTANGKIDKKALPDIEAIEQSKDKYAAPKNELEKIFVNIWQTVLRLDRIGVMDDFFELGGHSLIAVQIITKIETETGKNLPLAIFFQYPTIEQQVSSILKSESDAAFRSLVPIKATGSKMPFFIVHGDGLNVLNFSGLANYVDEEQPIYGLQAWGLDGINEPLDDIGEIAKHYISEIMETNPTGPYGIGGYSFGGYVAIEMRRQLELMGKEVKMLAMFDTNAINALSDDTFIVKLSKKIKNQLPKFLWFTKLFLKDPKTTIAYQRDYFKRQLKKPLYKAGLLKEPEVTGIYIQINKINTQHKTALWKYNLRPFNDRLFLFKCKERIYFIDDTKYMGWLKYALKGVKVYDVPGDHKTMFEQPHVKEVARILQDALDNC